MRKLLNVLYVTTQGAYLAKEGETVLVRVEQETRLRLPIHAHCLLRRGFDEPSPYGLLRGKRCRRQLFD